MLHRKPLVLQFPDYPSFLAYRAAVCLTESIECRLRRLRFTEYWQEDQHWASEDEGSELVAAKMSE